MIPRPLADAGADCGGKAVALARLIAAGLPVPDGFVLDTSVFHAAAGPIELAGTDDIGHALAAAAARIETEEPPATSPRPDGERAPEESTTTSPRINHGVPAALIAAVTERAAALGAVAVRSSATIEDGEAGAAAGVFSSRVAVPAAEVWPAIRAVWASALTPLAASYARRRGAPAIAIGVIVQRFVAGDRVTVYTRPPGSPGGAEVWVQRGEQLAKLPRDAGDPLIELALRAEHAIAAAAGADVELVCAADRTWIVQARPIVHPVRRVRVPPPPAVLAPLIADGRRWAWDVAHNPDPLSVAQAGLVERVERAGIAPWSLRVCAGFLYTTPLASAPPPVIASLAELDERVAELERRLDGVLDDREPPGSVEEAIARYLAFYAVWANDVVPLIAVARARLRPDQLAGARPSAVEATLLAAARGELDEAAVLARLGVMSPAWDVAVPTFAERPALIRAAIDRARGAVSRSAAPDDDAARRREPDDEAAAIARAGADLAERDDLWFARAQWLVRRALLDRAAALGLDGDNVFWLPLDAPAENDPHPSLLRSALPIDRDDARRRAGAARAAARRAASWDMPAIVGGDALPPGPPEGDPPKDSPILASRGPAIDRSSSGPPEGDAPPKDSPILASHGPALDRSSSVPLHGIGTGARVTGRVVRFASLASHVTVGPADIVVARAVTPALAVLVTGCAALISETGGPLDHGAALARELGIPCVVGCRDAWARLHDGMIVTVDGDAGVVTVDRLDET